MSAINLSMTSNAKDVLAEIGRIQDAIADKALVRAINRTVDAVATEASREVRKIYRIKAGDLRKAITKRRAIKGAEVAGEVIFSGRRLNLLDFGGRQTRRGVSVQVLVQGSRKVIPGTFIATNSHSGFRGIFRRVGKSRYPIKNLRAIAIPQAVSNKAVHAALVKVADDTFSRNYAQQIVFLSR